MTSVGWEFKCNTCGHQGFKFPYRKEDYGLYCSIAIDMCPVCHGEDVKMLKFHEEPTK